VKGEIRFLKSCGFAKRDLVYCVVVMASCSTAVQNTRIQ